MKGAYSRDELIDIARNALVGMPREVRTKDHSPCFALGCYEVHLLARAFPKYVEADTPLEFDEPLRTAYAQIFAEYELHRKQYERIWFEFPRLLREPLIIEVPEALERVPS